MNLLKRSGQSPAQFLAACALAFAMLPAAVAKDNSKEAFVLPGDVIIPQIATGGDGTFGFYMTFQAVNFTNSAATVTISFFDSDGNPMLLDVEKGGVLGSAASISAALESKGGVFARTFPAGAAKIGYARVESQPENSVAVSATFNQAVEGRPLFQSFIPLSSRMHDLFIVPVLNTGPFTGSVAIVSLAELAVAMTVRDASGEALCGKTRNFSAGEHFAFIVASELDCAADKDTLLEVSAPERALSGIGVTAADSGAFSTQPVYGPAPTPSGFISLSGNWNWEADCAGTPSIGGFNLQQDGASVTGRFLNRNVGDIGTITSGSVIGDQLEFIRTIQGVGAQTWAGAISSMFDGSVQVSGTIAGVGGPCTFSATRTAPTGIDLTGDWDWQAQCGGTPSTGGFNLQQDGTVFVGRFLNRNEGDIGTISDGAVDDLAFELTRTVQGVGQQTWAGEIASMPDGALELSGTIEGVGGPCTFSAARTTE